MYAFDKNKVDLTLTLDRAEFLPGEAVTGTFRVVTKKAFECTAIIVRCKCLETSTVHFYVNYIPVPDTKTHCHFNGTRLLAGNTSGAGGLLMEVGTVDYPFRIEIPVDVPHSHHVSAGIDSHKIVWSVKAAVVIPKGIDASAKEAIAVYPALRAEVFNELRARASPKFAVTSTLHSCACCGMFCCDKKDSSVTVRAHLLPSALVMCDPDTAGFRFEFFNQPPVQVALEPTDDFFDVVPPNTYTAKACVTIVNGSADEAIKGMKLVVDVREAFSGRAHTRVANTIIARQEVTFAAEEVVAPGATRHFAVLIQLPCGGSDAAVAPWNLVPVNTALIRAIACFNIHLTGVEMDPPFACRLPVSIAAAVDFANVVPRAGTTFNRDAKHDNPDAASDNSD